MAKTLTGMTPQREQRLTELMVERLAQSVEPRLRKEIRRAMLAYADSYNNDIKTAQAQQDHSTAITAILTPMWSRAFTTFGRRMLEGYKRYDPREAVKSLDVYEQAFRRFLAVYGARKVTQIIGTTQSQAVKLITAAIDEAQQEGFGEIETAKVVLSNVRSQAGVLSSYRAKMISRTESHSAAMTSNHTAAKSTGLPLLKEWVASRSERTRPDHEEANGQRVKIDDSFIVGGEYLLMPGDPSGSAEQIINCRCAQIYVLPD